jgi:Domain of unknown function (DUF3291)
MKSDGLSPGPGQHRHDGRVPRQPAAEGLVDLLAPINALADASPGFVWRLQTEEGNATALRAFEDERILINMSVWESIEDLREFVYRSSHLDVLSRRREWFATLAEAHQCLWWIPAGHIPTVAEAEERLTKLRENGPTPDAFNFRTHYPSPDFGSSAPCVEEDAWAS